MAAVQISARVDETLKTAIEHYCKSRDIVINHFIQDALLDRLEELRREVRPNDFWLAFFGNR